MAFDSALASARAGSNTCQRASTSASARIFAAAKLSLSSRLRSRVLVELVHRGGELLGKPIYYGLTPRMRSVHAERVSMPARVYVELLKDVETADDVTARARRELATWDGSMERDSVAPTIYGAVRARLHEAILRHHLGPLADEVSRATGRGAPSYLRQLASLLVTMAGKGDASLLPPGADWSSTVARALTEGVSDLRERLGDDVDSWQWGKVHYTRPEHTLSASFPKLAALLDPPSVPMGGDGDTPQAGSYSPADPFVMTGMSVARYVFDTADWDNSAWISPLGASGHPGSPHYSDQTAIWAEVDLVPMLYSWNRIDSEAETRQTLTPM